MGDVGERETRSDGSRSTGGGEASRRIVQLDSQPVQTQISSIAAISRSAINTGDW